jgi:endonuclease G
MAMRAVSIAATLILVPAVVHADNNGTIGDSRPADGSSAVVGGTDAPLGKWPDAAAMLFGGQAECTGTLIAPTVVLTAGHCQSAQLTQVLIGTASLNRASDGETIQISKQFPIDGSDQLLGVPANLQADITVVVLATPSRFAPRAIASGWASLDVKNGASVAIVGYGATDTQASQFTDKLQEVMSTITDFNCSVKAGCGTNELGAGGMGIDSCNGDSGGPLYLVTSYGNFLTGVTSRAYSDSTAPCGDGGIYGRPDQVLPIIEKVAGVKVTHGPEPTFDPLEGLRGDGAETLITANDPKSDSHTFTLKTPPTMGTAKVRADGRVRVCINKEAMPGQNDSLVVSVADTKDATRTLDVTIPIGIATNAVDGTCNVDAFEVGGDSGGCCQSGRSAGGALPLTLFVLVALRRRRRRGCLTAPLRRLHGPDLGRS